MNKIVLVEDNDEMRENIQEILELADYEVHAAENGKIGVEMIKQVMPDLILCDIMMPELDGYGVLYVISKNKNTANIPFIFLTAKTEKDDFRKGMNMGADDYLTKPFDDTQLLAAVEKRLNRIAAFTGSNKEDNDFNAFLKSGGGINELENLSKSKRIKKYAKKDTIFYEGDSPNFLYYINSGKIKTHKMNKDAKELVTNLYSAGDFLGYKTLIKDETYNETATVMDAAEVSLIPKQEFLDLLFSSKEVSMKFIKILAGSIDTRQEELLNLAYDTVRKRVADSLIKLEEKYKNEEDGNNFTIAISRDDLAAMVGTATESVIRTLSEFKHDGYIAIKGSNITILDKEKLKNFRF